MTRFREQSRRFGKPATYRTGHWWKVGLSLVFYMFFLVRNAKQIPRELYPGGVRTTVRTPSSPPWAYCGVRAAEAHRPVDYETFAKCYSGSESELMHVLTMILANKLAEPILRASLYPDNRFRPTDILFPSYRLRPRAGRRRRIHRPV